MTGKNSAGEAVNVPSKDKVDMAKFIVKSIESLNNTCLREEMAILGVRDKGNAEGAAQLEENQKEAEATSTGAFSLDMETQH
jgi:prophage maintenance system killer protein